MRSPAWTLAWKGSGPALACWLLLVPSGAQGQSAQPPSEASWLDKRVRSTRTASAPLIDGVLDDQVWQRAGRIDGLRQRLPLEDADPSERTTVRFLHDRDFLYIAVRCYDRHPDQIAVTKLRRDSDMQTEDSIYFVLDTFHDRRNAFFFQVSAIGAKRDALIEDNRRFLGDWDGIWYAKARIDERGWTAELAIPFKTVNFAEGQTTWGLNILRRVRHLNEEDVWANPDQDYSAINMSRAGTLEGLAGIEQGLGLDVKPAMALIYENDENGDEDLRGKPGGDVFYKLTPSLTGALTVNTDFSEAAPDDLRLNLTRFSLFFPETRDFFLQDAGIFEFGGLSRESGIPFFSRRIGLDDGEVVDLRGGGKVTGRHGPLSLGALAVNMEPYSPDDSTRERVDEKNLFVGRASLNVLEESSVGVIFTSGDPNSNDENYLAGGDFRYRDSGFRGENTLTADLWYQQSYSTGTHGRKESALGATLAYPNDQWNWRLRYELFDENYNPAMGFVTRTDIQRYEGRLRYRIRPQGYLRTVDTQVDARLVTTTANALETGFIDYDLVDLRNNPGDRLRLRYGFRKEELRAGQEFDIGDELFIGVGTYTWHRGSILLEAGQGRPIGGSLELGYGSFFDGRSLDAIARLDLRPSPHVNLSFEWEQRNLMDVGQQILDDTALPPALGPPGSGDATLRLVRTRLILNASADLSWNTVLQYISVDQSVELNSRLRWIVEPGNEIFLILNQSWLADSDRVAPLETEAVAKLVYTFRF